MRGACLTKNVLYYAKIKCSSKKYRPKLYKEICKTTFKERCTNHKKYFNAEKTTENDILNTGN